MIVTAIRNVREDVPKDDLEKKGPVSFSEDIEVFDIPALSDELAELLFYSTEQISRMKEIALMYRAGVTQDDVGADGQDLFQVEGLERPSFRRKSLERVSRLDLSPTRSLSPRNKRRGEASTSDDSVKQPAANLEILAAPAARQRDRRGGRGAPERTRSSTGPSRSDGGRGRGRGPPRRARSSMAAVGGNTANTLLAMQQAVIKKQAAIQESS
jgi:hypothetical protein